jgi:hypothetical protein
MRCQSNFDTTPSPLRVPPFGTPHKERGAGSIRTGELNGQARPFDDRLADYPCWVTRFRRREQDAGEREGFNYKVTKPA